MYTCGKGHPSTSADYCDECGAPINPTQGGATGGSTSAPAQSAQTGSSQTGGGQTGGSQGSGVTPDAAGQVCPECDIPQTGRFCEVCGHDFLAVPSAATGAPKAAGATPPTAPPAPATPATATPATATPATATPATATAAPATAAGAQAGTPAGGWRVVVTADKSYYERMQATVDPDAPVVAFPAYCPERRFALTGTEVLIGRRSRSRGIEPVIDLTGPPEDVGVSHAHALLVCSAEGSWSVVDLDSANGTYLNDAADPLAANVPVALADGDRVHLGAWTTLTVSAA